MNLFSTHKLIGEEIKEEFRCIRCGDRPNIVQIMLDPRRGKTLRVYECRCGERIWDD
jgi:DNA-directed RNA polymerase subunit RPC12/RpoP